jgi:signal transduction histidine kinase
VGDIDVQLHALATYLSSRRAEILHTWRTAIQKDPALTTSDSLPQVDLYDHIPALLLTFERELRDVGLDATEFDKGAGLASAAAHGLQRWQQGYDLHEVTRELGKLNQCVVSELEKYICINPDISHPAMARARRLWAAICSTGVEESVRQYFQLQQREAAGHVKDLESALVEIQVLEQQRADLWRQAAHDLRGNLGVVANVTVGLTHSGLRESARDEFVRILMRNVTSLHHLLDDVTSLARLQAGREVRHIEPIDVTPIIQQLCEGIRALARQRGLYLRCDGPPGFATDGDAVKIRRIAQNLVLNAVKFTHDGGITVRWGDSTVNDAKRWELIISDTGPGFHAGSGEPLTEALEKAHEQSPARIDKEKDGGERAIEKPTPIAAPLGKTLAGSEASGEGIGLSIVKRLCEMLDATIDMKSERGRGTTFRILFPREYTD